MTSRLITPQLAEQFKQYPLYSQDGKKKDAICLCVFFIGNIHDYYENFDVDAEAYIWIGSDGHGANGAPYHIVDIVKDMEEAEAMIADLYEAFKQYYSQLELQAVWQ